MTFILDDHIRRLESEGIYAPSLAEDPAEAMRAIRAAIPPAFTRLCKAVEAHEAGDEAPIRALMRERVGDRPDAILEGAAAVWLMRGMHMPIPYFTTLLNRHRERLKIGDARWYRRKGSWVYMHLNKNPRWELMRVLRRHPGSPYKRLRAEAPEAVKQAEFEGYCFDVDLLRPVDRLLVRAYKGLPDTGRRVENEHGIEQAKEEPLDLAPKVREVEDQEHDRDHEPWLEAFARAERERRRDRLSKEHTPKEQEILEFLRHRCKTHKGGLTPEQAIAAEFGIAASTARVHVRNLMQKRGA
jgi:DNA-binding CsgD family transcriptional regulator